MVEAGDGGLVPSELLGLALCCAHVLLPTTRASPGADVGLGPCSTGDGSNCTAWSCQGRLQYTSPSHCAVSSPCPRLFLRDFSFQRLFFLAPSICCSTPLSYLALKGLNLGVYAPDAYAIQKDCPILCGFVPCLSLPQTLPVPKSFPPSAACII